MHALAGRVTETAGAYADAAGYLEAAGHADAAGFLDAAAYCDAAGIEDGWDDAAGAFVDEDAAWGFLKKVGKAVSSAAKVVAPVVTNVVKTAVNPKAAIQIAKAAQQIAQGKRIDKVIGQSAKVIADDLRAKARVASTVASFVPGVGTGVSAALGAAAALSEGKPITEAVLAAARAAIPGGPLAQAAFDTALALARGQSLSQAALDAARRQLPGGPAAQAAFDTALALARGQKLQQAALAGASRLLPPSPASAAALDFARAALAGERLDRAALSVAGQKAASLLSQHIGGASPLVPFAATAARKALPNPFGQAGDPLGSDDPLAAGDPLADLDAAGPRFSPLVLHHLRGNVERVASALLNTPALRGLPAPLLAQRLGVAESDAREGLASVASAIARQSGALTPAHGLATRLGSASLDKIMGRIGRPAPPRYGARRLAFRRMQARGLDDAGAPDDRTTRVAWLEQTGHAAGRDDALADVTPDPSRAAANRSISFTNDTERSTFVQAYGRGFTQGLAEKADALTKKAAEMTAPKPTGSGADPVVKQAQADLLAFQTSISTREPPDWGPKDIDGKAGPRTARAASLFQRLWNKKSAWPYSHKLNEAGTLDERTVAALAWEVRGVPLPAALFPAPALPPPPLPETPPAPPPVVVAPPVPDPPALPPAPPPLIPVLTPPALPPAPPEGQWPGGIPIPGYVPGKELIPDPPKGKELEPDPWPPVGPPSPPPAPPAVPPKQASSDGGGAGLLLAALAAATLLG